MVSTLQIAVWAVFFISLYILVFWLLTFIEYIDKKPKKLKKLPLVTVAIPAYNEQNTIEKTLSSVIELDYPKNLLEIIVINDGSKDNTEDITSNFIKRNKDFDIKLINQINSGKGVALNIAIKEAKGDIFVVLDADSFVDKESLINMVHEFSDSNVAVVLPLMKVNNPHSWIQKLQWGEYVINFFYKSLNSVLNCVHVAPGPFSAYRKKVLIELNGFDENNLTEDLEITLRIQKANYRVVQLTNAFVYTNAPNSLISFYKQRNRWYKGTMFNMLHYKKMLMNAKYGDFGVLQMPQILISGFLAVLLILLTFYRFILKSLIPTIYRWSKIHFDFMSIIKNSNWNINWIQINFTNLFFLLITLLLTFFIIFLSYRFSKEKVFRYGLFSIPIYLLLYSILISGVWISVFIEILFNRKQRW